jgi:hypothetical protein
MPWGFDEQLADPPAPVANKVEAHLRRSPPQLRRLTSFGAMRSSRSTQQALPPALATGNQKWTHSFEQSGRGGSPPGSYFLGRGSVGGGRSGVRWSRRMCGRRVLWNSIQRGSDCWAWPRLS